MARRRSLLLIAAFILIFPRITFADSILNCSVPENFTIDISKHERAYLYRSELTVRVEKDGLAVISYPGLNSVNVRANDVAVAFKGYMVIENLDWRVRTEPERISQIYVDRISGIAQRVIQHNFDESSIRDCRLVLLPTDAERTSVHVRIANEIRRLAESCVELELCPRIDRMRTQDMLSSPSQNGSGLLSVYADPLAVSGTPAENDDFGATEFKLNHGTFQNAINKLVDIALWEIIEKLREKNEGTINVANIDKAFTTGSGILKTTGRFNAANGTLRDLTTIRRITDATLSHDGLKFVASCGFGLQILNLNYDHYKLKYGIIKVKGNMTADIDGMELEARVAVDYVQVPCRMELENLEVTKIGKLKIRITGVSPLNSLVSKLLGWIMEKWNDDVVRMIEKKLRSKVEARLENFNCERFRP